VSSPTGPPAPVTDEGSDDEPTPKKKTRTRVTPPRPKAVAKPGARLSAISSQPPPPQAAQPVLAISPPRVITAAVIPPAPIVPAVPALIHAPDAVMEQRFREWCATHLPGASPAAPPLPQPAPTRSMYDLGMHLATQNTNILKMMLLSTIN
jgi:hypothetical protein